MVIIKKSVDKMIENAFQSSGKVSIGEIYDYLETTYGFSVCNLSAFITGFLLKEYSAEPYRAMDAEGHRDNTVSYTHLDVYKRQLLWYSYCRKSLLQ